MEKTQNLGVLMKGGAQVRCGNQSSQEKGGGGGQGPLGREEWGPVEDLSAGEKLLRYLKFAFLLRASWAETPLAENLAKTV